MHGDCFPFHKLICKMNLGCYQDNRLLKAHLLSPWQQVLQHVRLPLLSPKFLVGTVGSDPLIKSDEECRWVLSCCCTSQTLAVLPQTPEVRDCNRGPSSPCSINRASLLWPSSFRQTAITIHHTFLSHYLMCTHGPNFDQYLYAYKSVRGVYWTGSREEWT